MMKYSLILSLTLVLIVSCSDKVSHDFVIGDEIKIDSSDAECPYLTKDTQGKLVLSWVRSLNDSTTAFCYSVADSLDNFSRINVVPGTGRIQPHGENLPKIIFKPDGGIICLWGEANPGPANKYAGRVFYVQSFDDGISWTQPKPLVADTGGRDQRYYDVAILPNGEAAISWLDNRKTTRLEGSALYYATTSGRDGFVNEKLISQPCCQCCRTDLFVDTKGYIHALYRAIIRDSLRDMVHIVSTDNGNTFTDPTRISDDNWVINGCPHTGPAMTETGNGLAFAWFTGGINKGCYFARAADNGMHFTPRDAVSKMGSHPQLATCGKQIVIVWDETHGSSGNFYKQIGIQSRSLEGNILATTLVTPVTEDGSYPVIISDHKKQAVIAYTQTRNKVNSVIMRKVSLDNNN